MRVIEQEIIQAIRTGSDFETGITEDMYRKKEGRRDVIVWSENFSGIFVYKLWGHQIAKGDTVARTLEISDCGYATATTKSRLNAVFAALDIPMACSVRKGKMVYYLYGKEVQEKYIKAGEWNISIN